MAKRIIQFVLPIYTIYNDTIINFYDAL